MKKTLLILAACIFLFGFSTVASAGLYNATDLRITNMSTNTNNEVWIYMSWNSDANTKWLQFSPSLPTDRMNRMIAMVLTAISMESTAKIWTDVSDEVVAMEIIK